MVEIQVPAGEAARRHATLAVAIDDWAAIQVAFGMVTVHG